MSKYYGSTECDLDFKVHFLKLESTIKSLKMLITQILTKIDPDKSQLDR